jgi:hypothetical protein
MSIYQYKAGIGNAASYQASGTPFVTGSNSLSGIMKIEFPRVTKSITFHEKGSADLFFYFHEDATDLNKFQLENIGSAHPYLTIDVKCKEIFISGSSLDFRIYASLTAIETNQMFELTGSGITE